MDNDKYDLPVSCPGGTITASFDPTIYEIKTSLQTIENTTKYTKQRFDEFFAMFTVFVLFVFITFYFRRSTR